MNFNHVLMGQSQTKTKTDEADYLIADPPIEDQQIGYVSIMKHKGKVIAIKLRGNVMVEDKNHAYVLRDMDPMYDVYGVKVGAWTPVAGHSLEELNRIVAAKTR